jgi:predicted O-methyltransferase YrrM
MLKKVVRRLFDEKGSLDKDRYLEWLDSNRMSFEDFAISLDEELWNESVRAAESIESRAHEVLKSIEHELGGGGAYPFLYFVTRYMEPDYVVETGVAAGYSTYSVLAAMEKNGRGTLLSSDFPYFRLPNPEMLIGIVVPDELMDRWELFVDGDETNLPLILKKAGSVDIFHYDSDKSYSGRKFAVSVVADSLSSRGILLMDDIQDNSFFYDWIQESNPSSWYVFEFHNKYVGMIGKPFRQR